MAEGAVNAWTTWREQRAEQAKVSPAAVRAFAEKNNQIDRYRDQALTEKQARNMSAAPVCFMVGSIHRTRRN